MMDKERLELLQNCDAFCYRQMVLRSLRIERTIGIAYLGRIFANSTQTKTRSTLRVFILQSLNKGDY